MDDRLVSRSQVQAMIAEALWDMVPRAEVEQMIREAVQAGLRRPIKIFGLNASKDFASKVAAHLNLPLTPHVEKMRDDDEC